MIDDPLIDGIAKAMTSAQPDARLAERVAARLADARTPRVRVMPWLLLPIAAAAALVIAIVVAWKPETRVTTRQVTMGDIAIAATPPALAPVVVRHASSPPPAPEPALEPIEIDPIAIQPLVETNAVQITPIAIDRIDISPMP